MLAADSILECLKREYAIRATHLHPVNLGADIDATTYRVDAKDKRCYFVKVRKELDFDSGTAVLSFLESQGVHHILPPLKTTQEKNRQALGSHTVTVYSYIHGEDGFHRPLSKNQWIELGQALNQIHSLKLPQDLKRHIRLEDASNHWRLQLGSHLATLDTAPVERPITHAFLSLMQRHQQTVERLIESAERLSQKLDLSSHRLVLCHSDLHAGNVLIEPGGGFYLVDWDMPILAPKERDLMFIGGGVGNTWNLSRESDLFYQGYKDLQIDPIALAYYRCERIVEDLAIYTHELRRPTSNEKSCQEMLKHVVDMFESEGVVDIALATVEFS